MIRTFTSNTTFSKKRFNSAAFYLGYSVQKRSLLTNCCATGAATSVAFGLGFGFMNLLISTWIVYRGFADPAQAGGADVSHVYEMLQGNIQTNLIEVHRLMDQLNDFVSQYNVFLVKTGVNVVIDGDGSIGIDVLESLNDTVAQFYATNVNVLDGLIHHHIHSLEHHLSNLSNLENEVRQLNVSYVSQLPALQQKLAEISHSFRL